MTYLRSVVTFLDILGFRELVDTKPAGVIRKLLDDLQNETKPTEFAAKAMRVSVVSFSDCTVRAAPILPGNDNPLGRGIFSLELMLLVLAQSSLASQGVFVRGAISVGDIFIDGSTVFGPALVQAYKLESEFAVYPRIIVDPAVLNLLETLELFGPGKPENERAQIRSVLRKDSDGLYFVDYVYAGLDALGGFPHTTNFLQRHKRAILGSNAAHGSLSKVAAKLLWLATYHNSVIERLGEDWFAENGLDISDFVIGKDEMPLLVEI